MNVVTGHTVKFIYTPNPPPVGTPEPLGVDNHSYSRLDLRRRDPNPLPEFNQVMYVCVCLAVTDTQIREVVNQGASSYEQVQCRLPIGACCGRCEPTAREMIHEQVSTDRSRKVAA